MRCAMSLDETSDSTVDQPDASQSAQPRRGALKGLIAIVAAGVALLTPIGSAIWASLDPLLRRK